MAEEWAIHDYSGFHDVCIGESAGFDELCELAEGIGEHGEAFAAYCSYMGTWDITGFEDAYCGTWNSETDYAENLADECLLHDVPDNIKYYFDYEKFSRDLFCSDYYSVDVNGGVAVFRHE